MLKLKLPVVLSVACTIITLSTTLPSTAEEAEIERNTQWNHESALKVFSPPAKKISIDNKNGNDTIRKDDKVVDSNAARLNSNEFKKATMTQAASPAMPSAEMLDCGAGMGVTLNCHLKNMSVQMVRSSFSSITHSKFSVQIHGAKFQLSLDYTPEAGPAAAAALSTCADLATQAKLANQGLLVLLNMHNDDKAKLIIDQLNGGTSTRLTLGEDPLRMIRCSVE